VISSTGSGMSRAVMCAVLRKLPMPSAALARSGALHLVLALSCLPCLQGVVVGFLLLAKNGKGADFLCALRKYPPALAQSIRPAPVVCNKAGLVKGKTNAAHRHQTPPRTGSGNWVTNCQCRRLATLFRLAALRE
jgi:hypothetical protein